MWYSKKDIHSSIYLYIFFYRHGVSAMLRSANYSAISCSVLWPRSCNKKWNGNVGFRRIVNAYHWDAFSIVCWLRFFFAIVCKRWIMVLFYVAGVWCLPWGGMLSVCGCVSGGVYLRLHSVNLLVMHLSICKSVYKGRSITDVLSTGVSIFLCIFALICLFIYFIFSVSLYKINMFSS